MPEYSYICEHCSNRFSLFFTIQNYVENPTCSKCNSLTIRDYQEDLSSLNTSVKKSDSELKTVGDLAKRNTERMSEDHKAYLYKKHNDYKETTVQKELPKGMTRIKKPAKTKWTT
jgi:hypothetical protein